MRVAVSSLDDAVRDALKGTLESLRGHLEAELVTLRGQLEAELAKCQETLVRAAQDAGTRIAAAEHAMAEARKEADRRITEVREAAAEEARQLKEQLEASQRDAESAWQDADTARDLVEAARNEIEQARRETEAARRDVGSARREAEALGRERDRLIEELHRADERVIQALRISEAVHKIDAATTFGDVLDSLVESAGREAGRAAIFLVKGDRLRHWRIVGFDSVGEKLELGLDESGPMNEAVRTARAVSAKSGQLPAFAGTGSTRNAGAWPISVGGSVVAVLYADGARADNKEEPIWPASLEVLARYAGRVLEGITISQATRLTTSKSSDGASKPGTTGQLPAEAGRQPAGSIQ
jgi:hypothetical protein